MGEKTVGSLVTHTLLRISEAIDPRTCGNINFHTLYVVFQHPDYSDCLAYIQAVRDPYYKSLSPYLQQKSTGYTTIAAGVYDKETRANAYIHLVYNRDITEPEYTNPSAFDPFTEYIRERIVGASILRISYDSAPDEIDGVMIVREGMSVEKPDLVNVV